MPITPLSNTLVYPKPEDYPSRLPPVDIDLSDDGVSVENGVKKTEMPDGSLEIDLAGNRQTKEDPTSSMPTWLRKLTSLS